MAEIGVPVATSAHIINCAAPAYTSKHNNSISIILNKHVPRCRHLSITTNVATNIDAIKIATYDGINQLKLSIITMTNTISTM